MKLAEALVLRADLQKRLAQLRERLRQSALVQEGEQPPENPEQLLTELASLLSQLGDMIVRINRTNMQVHLSADEILSDALARRDMLSLRYSIITGLAETAGRSLEQGDAGEDGSPVHEQREHPGAAERRGYCLRKRGRSTCRFGRAHGIWTGTGLHPRRVEDTTVTLTTSRCQQLRVLGNKRHAHGDDHRRNSFLLSVLLPRPYE